MLSNTIIDMCNIKPEDGGTQGNLLKTIVTLNNRKYYCKTGRQKSRDYPNNYGIEPIVEVICYRLAKALNLNCAEQEFGIASIMRRGVKQLTLITLSADYNINNYETASLSKLLVRGEIKYDNYESIIKFNNSKKYIEQIMLFDYIIANEDRHNRNIEWFYRDNIYEGTPIFDNGYALLYDDIKGMLGKYKQSATICNCNSFYGYFDCILKTIETSTRVKELCNIDIKDSVLKEIIDSTMEEYFTLRSKYVLNNVELRRAWFTNVYEFLKWRITNVKTL